MDDNNEELDEMQAQRENSLAEKSGKEAFNRQAKKNQRNQTIKKIWQKIPVTVKLFLAKLLIYIVAIILICSIITVIIDYINSTSKTQKQNLLNSQYYIAGNHIVHTQMDGAAPVLTKEQLEEVIQTKYTGDAQTNLMGVIDDLIYIQDTHNVNAVFAIAVAQQESSCGTNWSAISSETYNWMSVTGSYNGQTYKNPNSTNEHTWRVYDSFNTATKDFGNLIANDTYYFKANKYDVNSIAISYCNETWGTSVNNIMKEIYEAAGIVTAGGEVIGETTDGFQIFKDNASGRQYIEYKQNIEEHKGIVLCHTKYGNSLFSHGCALTADAIIGSGFNSIRTPIGVKSVCLNLGLGYCSHFTILGELTGLSWAQDTSATWNEIFTRLKMGYPISVSYRTKGNSAIFGTVPEQHFVALLALSEDGSQVYISNPNSNTPEKNGWKNILEIKNDTNVILINYNYVVGN